MRKPLIWLVNAISTL